MDTAAAHCKGDAAQAVAVEAQAFAICMHASADEGSVGFAVPLLPAEPLDPPEDERPCALPPDAEKGIDSPGTLPDCEALERPEPEEAA